MSTSVLDENVVYLAYDRWVCGRLDCAGWHAARTGRTTSGYRLTKVTGADVEAWMREFDEPLSCECGAISLDNPQAIVQ
ncbi:hypothetical protein FH969_12690 [Miniimonas arenae]|uniref:Uncharacterized protein n=1 Tax=Miniimonas arenae TaxID=676201 RepID=A0A5C5BBC3_9MICO|nr:MULTISPECIES: hypothetical protein [Miniimonas]TNU73176.1 hypothetical protein FH969_12690 [Miniimonas arenae]